MLQPAWTFAVAGSKQYHYCQKILGRNYRQGNRASPGTKFRHHAFVGMARMRHTLQALQARAQAAIALAEGGSAGLVQTLTSLLPPVANSGKTS